jgi:hypothetical protein
LAVTIAIPCLFGVLYNYLSVQWFFLRKRIANHAQGVIMVKITLIMGLCLFLFSSALVLAGTDPHMVTIKAEDQADTKHTSTNQLYVNANSDEEIIACTEPRPQVCTQDYRPVCAELQDGSFKTFSNGCSACSDPAVNGYREGACE